MCSINLIIDSYEVYGITFNAQLKSFLNRDDTNTGIWLLLPLVIPFFWAYIVANTTQSINEENNASYLRDAKEEKLTSLLCTVGYREVVLHPLPLLEHRIGQADLESGILWVYLLLVNYY